jgi:hypothetical protein
VAADRVTSKDVAYRAGVSRTTVSLVLNNVHGAQISQATRQRVLQAAHDLDYVPDAAAKALASRQSQIIGLILIRTPQQIASMPSGPTNDVEHTPAGVACSRHRRTGTPEETYASWYFHTSIVSSGLNARMKPSRLAESVFPPSCWTDAEHFLS